MPAITPELLTKFDVAGPRYTSYPTADRFVEAFGEPGYLQALDQRRTGPAAMALPPRRPETVMNGTPRGLATSSALDSAAPTKPTGIPRINAGLGAP